MVIARLRMEGQTIPSNKERAEALTLLGIADAVLLMETDELSETIDKLKPKILVLGNEFKNESRFKQHWTNNGNRVVRFIIRVILLPTADLLSGSERDSRNAGPLQTACAVRGL